VKDHFVDAGRVRFARLSEDCLLTRFPFFSFFFLWRDIHYFTSVGPLLFSPIHPATWNVARYSVGYFPPTRRLFDPSCPSSLLVFLRGEGHHLLHQPTPLHACVFSPLRSRICTINPYCPPVVDLDCATVSLERAISWRERGVLL